MKRAVVLGGTGFIGAHLVQKLQQEGWDVESFGQKETDLVEPGQITKLAAGWPRNVTVFFCAGITPNRDASWHAARANILMARHLADAMPAGGWRGLLFLSSSAVYGKPAKLQPIHEDTPFKPESPYGFSKVESESILAERAWSRNTPFLALRPSIIFGRHDRGQSLIGRWTTTIARNEPVAVKGKGSARLDLLPADNLCDIIAEWAKKPIGGALNAASGQSLPASQLIDLVAEALAKKATIDRKTRSGEAEFDQIFDTTRLQTLFPVWLPNEIREAVRTYARELILNPPE